MLEAWADDLPEFVIFENVPRIVTRGRKLLDQITGLLNHYGYAVAENFHDCGEICGLHQSRKRFLLVARNVEKVPPFLYQPEKHNLRPVGELLEKMPLPGDIVRGGAMHSIPNLQWKTWVRLAFVEAGSDWRSLNKLNVKDGKLADYLLVPEMRNGVFGVTKWEEPSSTVTSKYQPSTGNFSVADPRAASTVFSGHGVADWTKPMGAVQGESYPTNGLFSVADPRGEYGKSTHKNVYRVIKWEEPSQVIGSGHGPSSGGMSVADPRYATTDDARQNIMRIADYNEPVGAITGASHVTGGAACIADPRWPNSQGEHSGKYHVTGWNENSKTITGIDRIGSGALCVADPRALDRKKGDAYLTGGHYGVVGWDQPSYSVSGSANHDNGWWNVADPRIPEENEKLVAIIRSMDGTWHRPFTTLELAALQSLVDPDDLHDLDGDSDAAKRERIGNVVPPLAAQAIADLMGQTLLMAWTGQTFMLSSASIWVRNVAIGMSVDIPTPSYRQ
jgi:site-specific DNA-cytosine methylase